MPQKLKAEKKKYGKFIRYDYYLILGLGDYYDVFIKDFVWIFIRFLNKSEIKKVVLKYKDQFVYKQ